MEINKISRIVFRKDTLSNWRNANPILENGEPAYIIDTGAFKIGDGRTAFNDLGTHSTPVTAIGEVPADGQLYVRTRENTNTPGVWESISEKYNRKTLADILEQPYNVEMPMNYSITKFDGSIKQVYAQRFLVNITKEAGVSTNDIIESGVDKIIDFGGTLFVDVDHEYAIASHANNFSASLFVDKENNINTLNLTTSCVQSRENCPVDIWVLYTRV